MNTIIESILQLNSDLEKYRNEHLYILSIENKIEFLGEQSHYIELEKNKIKLIDKHQYRFDLIEKYKKGIYDILSIDFNKQNDQGISLNRIGLKFISFYYELKRSFIGNTYNIRAEKQNELNFFYNQVGKDLGITEINNLFSIDKTTTIHSIENEYYNELLNEWDYGNNLTFSKNIYSSEVEYLANRILIHKNDMESFLNKLVELNDRYDEKNDDLKFTNIYLYFKEKDEYLKRHSVKPYKALIEKLFNYKIKREQLRNDHFNENKLDRL